MFDKRILIIDDSKDDVILTKMVISRIRHDTIAEAAMSGDEGLALLRNEKSLPALILLDLKMPRMDGIAVLKKLRADSHLRHIPVVVLTNSELEFDQDASIKAGADGFLQKASNLKRFKIDMEGVMSRWLDK